MPSLPSLHICIMVWGEAFVDAMVRTTMAGLLSPGNLPAAAQSWDITTHIYTDRASAPVATGRLSPMAASGALEVHLFEETTGKAHTIAEHIQGRSGAAVKHEVNVQAIHHLIERVLEQGREGVILLLDTNFLISDGTLSSGLTAMERGARASFFPTLRLTPDKLPQDFKMGATGRAIMAHFAEAMHPTTRSCVMTAPAFSDYPAQILWPVGEREFLCHAFFSHAFLFRPCLASMRTQRTPDYDLGLRSCETPEHIYVPRSTDEGFICKVTEEGYAPLSANAAGFDIGALAHFILTSTNHRHREIAQRPVRLSTGAASKAEWAEVEALARATLDQAYALAEHALETLPQDQPELQAAKRAYLGSLDDFTVT